MSAPAVERASANEPNLGQLLEKTLHHAKELVQAEISLARHELGSEISAAVGSVVLFVSGVVFLQAALTTLSVLLVIRLGGGWLGLLVVAVLAAVGGVLCVRAKRELERKRMPQTSSHLALDARQVMETVK